MNASMSVVSGLSSLGSWTSIGIVLIVAIVVLSFIQRSMGMAYA